jgi:hypothetical protein
MDYRPIAEVARLNRKVASGELPGVRLTAGWHIAPEHFAEAKALRESVSRFVPIEYRAPNPDCIRDGCDEAFYALGLCRQHYFRQYFARREAFARTVAT